MPTPRNGLIAEYLLDGDARDSSGHDRHGQVIGAKATADRFGRPGRALAFDGKDDYVIVVPPPGPLAQALTISTWVRFDAAEYNGWSNAILCQDSGEAFHHSYTQHGRVFQLLVKDRHITWHRMHWQGDGDVQAERPFSPTTWHHVVATVSAGTHRLYLDGELQGRADSWFATSADEPLYIGRRAPHIVGNPFGPTYHQTGAPCFFHGAIDDIRMYDRALSEDEINALFHEDNEAGTQAKVSG